jgi:hypothetical protein
MISNANADTLSLSGGTASVLPGTFNPSGLAAMSLDGIGIGTAITIFSGTSNTGGLSISPSAGVTFTLMGKPVLRWLPLGYRGVLGALGLLLGWRRKKKAALAA